MQDHAGRVTSAPPPVIGGPYKNPVLCREPIYGSALAQSPIATKEGPSLYKQPQHGEVQGHTPSQAPVEGLPGCLFVKAQN